jgi:GTP-dependent phosphoenolpyruvate carboxykinase
MNVFIPSDSFEATGITLHRNIGSFQDQIVNIIGLDPKDILVTEVSDEDYEILRPLLKKIGTEFKVVVNIPEVDSPRSFLYEEDPDHVITFDNLRVSEKSDADKFLEEMDDKVEDMPEGIQDESA